MGKKTHMMMDWEIMRPEKDGYEKGFALPPQRRLINAEVRESMGTEGGRDGQSRGRVEAREGRGLHQGGRRKQMESRHGSTESGGHSETGRWRGKEGVR